ncbi:hypothetical protein TrRE_jg6536, partial [Triparma retinervis]
MKVLVVDGFGKSAVGRRQFEDFFSGVKQAFEVTKGREASILFDVEPIPQLYKYVYAYERNEYTDPAAIKLFDKIDMIFVDCDHRLLPWGKRTRPLLLLLKTAFFTNKCVFAAGGATQMLSFVISTGGKKIRVLNGEEGGKVGDMERFVVPKVIGPDDVYLDSEAGDFYMLKAGRRKGQHEWVPAGNIGSHVHDVTANLKTLKFGVKPPSPRKKVFAKPPHKTVPKYPVRAIMAGEVKVRVEREHLRHAAFRGFGEYGQTFLGLCDNEWSLDVQSNKRNPRQYRVLASSERGPQVIEYENMWAVQFHVKQKYKSSLGVVTNFVRLMHEKICNEAKIGISCDFLKQGDPNLKPRKVGALRPFSAPVRRGGGWRKEFGDTMPTGGDGSDMSSSGAPSNKVKTVAAAGATEVVSGRRGGSGRRGSFATQVEEFNPDAIAQDGYATPRFCSARGAVTPRGGVKISSHQEDAETEAEVLSGRAMSSVRTAVNRTEGGKAEFNKRLLLLGRKVGVDMTFASTFNERVREVERRRLEDVEAGIIDDITEGDEGYFDDILGDEEMEGGGRGEEEEEE